jgi:hypothetical protein
LIGTGERGGVEFGNERGVIGVEEKREAKKFFLFFFTRGSQISTGEDVARSSAPAPAPSSSPWSPSAVADRRDLRSRSAAAAVAAPGGRKRRREGSNGDDENDRFRAAKESSRLFWQLWHRGWYSEFAAHRQRLALARLERDRERVRRRKAEEEERGGERGDSTSDLQSPFFSRRAR